MALTRNKRAGSTQNQSSDDQTPVDIHQDVSKRLDYLLHVLTDLSMQVAAVEVRQDLGQASVSASPPTSHPRRRARHQVTPTPYDELTPTPARPGTMAGLLIINSAFNHPEPECIRKGHPTSSPASPSWIGTKHNGYRPDLALDMRLDLLLNYSWLLAFHSCCWTPYLHRRSSPAAWGTPTPFLLTCQGLGPPRPHWQSGIRFSLAVPASAIHQLPLTDGSASAVK